MKRPLLVKKILLIEILTLRKNCSTWKTPTQESLMFKTSYQGLNLTVLASQKENSCETKHPQWCLEPKEKKKSYISKRSPGTRIGWWWTSWGVSIPMCQRFKHRQFCKTARSCGISMKLLIHARNLIKIKILNFKLTRRKSMIFRKWLKTSYLSRRTLITLKKQMISINE